MRFYYDINFNTISRLLDIVEEYPNDTVLVIVSIIILVITQIYVLRNN